MPEVGLSGQEPSENAIARSGACIIAPFHRKGLILSPAARQSVP